MRFVGDGNECECVAKEAKAGRSIWKLRDWSRSIDMRNGKDAGASGAEVREAASLPFKRQSRIACYMLPKVYMRNSRLAIWEGC